jgi:hypothetical protein
MPRFPAILALLLPFTLPAQNLCPPTPAYSICDIAFDVPGDPAGVELNAEFRGPSHKTYLVSAFPSGPHRLIVRFSPFEPGTWDVRLSSTLSQFHDKQLQFTATPSESDGWIQVANFHHFRYTGVAKEGNEGGPAHLWVGDTLPDSLDHAGFERWASERAAAGVNHIRIRVPNSIDEPAFDELDARLAFINNRGIVADLVLTPPAASGREARQKYFRYVLARCAARNSTWVLLDQFERYDHAHDLLREMAAYLDEDPYHRVRTVGAAGTSGSFADEKWMNVRFYGSPEWAVSAVEGQIYLMPAVSEVRAPSPDEFRHRLWNAAMSGSYIEAAATDSTMVRYLEVWKKFFADTRHWDIEPFFDVDGARGLSLPQTEYILYLEKPGPVTVRLNQKHKWNVGWINPLTGERTELKDFKEDTFVGEPPNNAHDWVLYIDREGHKESLKSFKFESREVVLQEIEVDPAKIPYEIVQPVGDNIAFQKPVSYAVKLKKETHATRNMSYLWTGEVTADDEGYRVLATGPAGSFQVPANIIRHFPATLHVRLYGLNGLGKLYSVDQNFGVVE